MPRLYWTLFLIGKTMRRAKNLYLKIAEPDNMRLAFLKACRGKRDRAEVVAYRNDLTACLVNLRQQLLARDVSVGDYRFFTIHDPKQRQICAAGFPERVLHHAVMNVVEPVLERYAIADSFACRKGKGHRSALARAQHFAKRYPWYLKLDIRKYFDSIDHEVLLQLLARRVKDADLNALFCRVVASYATEPGCGLPIGNLLSQHFANFYLGLFDHWVKEELHVKGYLRYMDDFVLFGGEKEQLTDQLPQVERFLMKHLHLSLKDNRQLNRTQRGLPYLGFRVFSHQLQLAPRSKKRFVAKLRAYEHRQRSGVWDELQLSQHVTALVEFVKTADTKGLRQNVLRGSF